MADGRPQEWFVSYAWGDDTETGRALDRAVEDICAAAERRGLRVRRDRNELAVGDSISDFVRRMGEGDRVFVVLSAKYLRSPWCMFELFEVWQNAGRRRRAFLATVRVFVLPDANIDTMPRRIEWARLWKQQYNEINETIRTDHELVGEEDFRAFRRMREFYLNVGDILATIADMVQPRTLEQFEAYGFDDPRTDAEGRRPAVSSGRPAASSDGKGHQPGRPQHPSPTREVHHAVLAGVPSAVAWADDTGVDQCGRWASFSVVAADGARVVQRLRWCPPGRFMMGSPEDEEGGYGDEGPRHEVVFARGFWMFETSCRQELWQAVMGGNPSAEQGPMLPVTNVSWEDARRFVERLNAAKPGLGIDLPSEAQWEYACRAGTETAYSFGPTISRQQVNFGGKGLVPVGSLPPNGWGLHEMHGSIWEWCADTWHGDYGGAPADGSAWIDGDAAGRVIRGGSWGNEARYVRAAYRVRDEPGHRGGSVGFRCARVQRE